MSIVEKERAEAEFQKAKALFQRHYLSDAQVLFERAAVSLADHPELDGYRLYLRWLLDESSPPAAEVLARLGELSRRAPGAVALLEFQARVLMRQGELERVGHILERALLLDP